MSWHHLFVFLTDFANQGVIIPVSITMGCYFWLAKWRNGCYFWLFSLGLTLLTIIVSKIFFYVLAQFVDFGINLKSPSSHAAAGAMVYGCLIGLIFGKSLKAAIIASSAFAILFSITRLGLFVHTRSEVVIGSLFGILGAATFIKLAGQIPDSINRLRLAVISGIVIIFCHGNDFSGEYIIKAASRTIGMLLKQALADQIGG